MKHLTVEMQKSLQGEGKSNSASQLAAFDQIRAASSDFQVFETGQILLSAIDPKSHEKFEVHVDSDDLSGDTTIWIFHFTSSTMESNRTFLMPQCSRVSPLG